MEVDKISEVEWLKIHTIEPDPTPDNTPVSSPVPPPDPNVPRDTWVGYACAAAVVVLAAAVIMKIRSA